MTVLYQLATPIVTDISAEEMEAYKALKNYTPTTVISSDSGVWMEADLVDSDILYPHAENTSYDNSTSGLTSDNVQGAIDENAEAISALNSRTYEDVEVTTIENSYVSPFTAHGNINYDLSKIISLEMVGTEGDNSTRFGLCYYSAGTLNVVTNAPGTYKIRIYHD